jgi:hypothetical protein
MRSTSILVLGWALAATPALVRAASANPTTYPGDLTAPHPRDMGPNGSQFERYANAGVSGVESGAGSFPAMCGLHTRLDLSVNFTGARPAGDDCDCDFRAEAGEINGYPNQLNAGQRNNPKTVTSARAARPPQHARVHAYAKQRVSRHTETARLEAGHRRPGTAGSANRSMPRTSLQWIALLLGGFCLCVTGLALRRLGTRHS